jgi:hypothetical protein
VNRNRFDRRRELRIVETIGTHPAGRLCIEYYVCIVVPRYFDAGQTRLANLR